MFHFSHPEALLLALLLPPLAWWWLVRRRGALRHPSAGALANLPQGWGPLAFWGGLVLRILSLGLLVLAAAGPRWPDLRTRIQTEGIAIVMVVDVSGSMNTKDFDWEGKAITRLAAVKKVFRLFVSGSEDGTRTELEGRPTDHIGLVVFGSIPDTACPLTLSHSALLRALDEQQPRKVPGESQTNIIDAVAEGLYRLEKSGPRRRVLILLSDGEHNEKPASDWSMHRVVQVAVARGVPLYTIDAAGTGLSEGEGSQPTSVAEREKAARILKQLAEGTGGEYFKADNTEALLGVYQAIDRKERSPIESFQYRRYHEGYPWLGLASFILFVSVLTLEMTLWRRVP
jgi:Ca-activated chloride channel family protein